MRQKIKTIIILIIVFILIAFLFYKFSPFLLGKFKTQSNSLSSKENLTESLPTNDENSEGLSFSLPVDEKYVEKLILDGDNNKFAFFNLDPGSSIRSLFSGKIVEIIVKQTPFKADLGDDVEVNIVIIRDKDEKFIASYTFSGIVLVKNGDEVGPLSVLGEVDDKKMKFHGGTNFFLEIIDNENNSISLSKEIFK